MQNNLRLRALAGALTFLLSAASYANDGPPMSGGTISNPTLVKNQDVAKAQAAGVISTFMTQGAKTCDTDGKNCHSVFGSDDTPDYTSLQQSSQALTGVSSFSFMEGNGDDGGDANSIASQMGTLALACGDTAPKKIAGIAVRFTNCTVNTNGDAQVTVQVCTGPARSNPITAPANQVECSNDPASKNFRAPAGFVCKRPACDTEAVGSLDGWSAPQTVSWQANLPASATEDQKTKNGLGMVFYPALNGQVASFTANSDNMTAVKIVQSFVNNETKRTAVGLKIAYRHKTTVTKQMMVDGPSSVPNPGANTAQWDSIVKLQGNEKIPQYQQQYAANGTECLQQIQGGIASDGKITVCDPNYTNESGIKPLQKTATVAVEGQECGTVPQCLNKVVNTSTWTETCSAEVPMAMRSCTTKQDYTVEKISYVRTRASEMCHEERFQAEYSCNTYMEAEACHKESVLSSGGVDLDSTSGDSNVVKIGNVDPYTGQYRIGAVGDDYWKTGYYSREFTVDILDASAVKTFRMYSVGFDDLMAVAINDNWVWSDYNGGTFHPEFNAWGKIYDQCLSGYTEWGEWSDCYKTEPRLQSQWERRTSFKYPVSVDMRPYLRNGRNIIRMDTGVVGAGEGWVFLEISAWKVECKMTVQNTCGEWEAKR